MDEREDIKGLLRTTPTPKLDVVEASQEQVTPGRPSAPNSAKSDISKHRPLPPIKPHHGINKASDQQDNSYEFASVTESELAERADLFSSDDESNHVNIRKHMLTVKESLNMETQTDWSWIETMKLIQKMTSNSDLEVADAESIKARTISVLSKASKAVTLISQSSKLNLKQEQPTLPTEGSAFLALSPSGISAGSMVGADEMMPSLVLPYRDDEYGIPILHLSDSDSESEGDVIDKAKVNKTLPSVGPPQILQFKRDINKKVNNKSDDEVAVRSDEAVVSIDDEALNATSANDIIPFTGVCEFCNELIKPFPTLHQQQIIPPEQLYCCEEFATFVRLTLLPPAKNSVLIDIKPHAHYGSKKERAAAQEKAQERLREREIERVRLAAKASEKEKNNSESGKLDGKIGGGGGGIPGQGLGGQQLGGANLFAFARTMKTINFQLSSQKCIDEGYVIRPPSAQDDFLQLADPFEIEPVEWYTGFGEDSEMGSESAFDSVDKPLRKIVCTEKFYPDGSKFLIMFSDGTGSVFYSNGQLAVSVSSVEPGKFTYLIYDAQTEGDKPQNLLAAFEPDAMAACYYKNGCVRLFLDQLGGLELNETGSRKKKWGWLDNETHTHAPPVQPLCFALNKYIGLRVLGQDNVIMTFLSYQRSCKFNVGVKLKLVHPENLPLAAKYDEDLIYMNEKSNQISGLLQKIENLLKYPHSSKVNKMPLPKRVTIKAEKLEKLKQQSVIEKEKYKEKRMKKNTRILSPLHNLEDDIDPVLMTETGDLSIPYTQRRPPKYAVVVN